MDNYGEVSEPYVHETPKHGVIHTYFRLDSPMLGTRNVMEIFYRTYTEHLLYFVSTYGQVFAHTKHYCYYLLLCCHFTGIDGLKHKSLCHPIC